MKLVIGNKRYSSWSMRPWLLMRAFAIAFDELVLPLDQPASTAAITNYGAAGRVPILLDGTACIWDSLAIAEYIAELHPQLAIWPADRFERAKARSLAAEMHAGFVALRRALPMNMGREPRPVHLDAEREAAVMRDVARMEQIWTSAAERAAGDDPFMFGPFSAVDAFFAPVVNRLHAYAWPVNNASRRYMDAIMALPAWRDWQAGADAEGWRLPRIEEI